jgi:hypothetical protein
LLVVMFLITLPRRCRQYQVVTYIPEGVVLLKIITAPDEK